MLKRVSKIQSFSYIKWNHVSTISNPEDLVSHGANSSQLIGNGLWFHGPKFLQLPETKWPTRPVTIETTDETVTSALITSRDRTIVLDSKFACKYFELIRTFCYIRRFFAKNLRHDPLSTDEFDEALFTAKRVVQE